MGDSRIDHHHRRRTSAPAAKLGFVSTLLRFPSTLSRTLAFDSSSSSTASRDGTAPTGSQSPLLGRGLPSSKVDSSTTARRSAIWASVLAIGLCVWFLRRESSSEQALSESDGDALKYKIAAASNLKNGIGSSSEGSSGGSPTTIIETITQTVTQSCPTMTSSPTTLQGDRSTKSCELCMTNPENPLCEYGLDSIRQSRHFLGSGHRVRRFAEKALRGETVRIGVLGASVTAGHGVLSGQTWQERMLDQIHKAFPNVESYVGASPGMGSGFFAYCFGTLVPQDLDLYLVELDLNNDFGLDSFVADDRLYRALLGLPQEPAVVRVSVFAIFFTDLMRGFLSNLAVSSFFDVPIIGVRWLLTHTLQHPEVRDTFFSNLTGIVDYRHMSAVSHRALGDMLAIYLIEQKCDAERRQTVEPTEFQLTPWPDGSGLGSIPRLHFWDMYSMDKAADPVVPSCQYAGSESSPLVPSGDAWQGTWRKESWNGKQAWRASEVGAQISFEFTGAHVGIFVWVMGIQKDGVSPGQALCWVDEEEDGLIVETYAQGAVAGSQWKLIADDLEYGHHVLTCEIVETTGSGGHDFRIMGVANN